MPRKHEKSHHQCSDRLFRMIDGEGCFTCMFLRPSFCPSVGHVLKFQILRFLYGKTLPQFLSEIFVQKFSSRRFFAKLKCLSLWKVGWGQVRSSRARSSRDRLGRARLFLFFTLFLSLFIFYYFYLFFFIFLFLLVNFCNILTPSLT